MSPSGASEWISRFRTAWYALRGWSVIHGAVINYGEIDFTRGGRPTRVWTGGGTTIRSCRIFTTGKLTSESAKQLLLSGNFGNAIWPDNEDQDALIR